jgi:hypothetical protein
MPTDQLVVDQVYLMYNFKVYLSQQESVFCDKLVMSVLGGKGGHHLSSLD